VCAHLTGRSATRFKAEESTTKLRGGYYTPHVIARFLARWVLSARPSSLLEPSCGDGAFITAVRELGRQDVDFLGVERLPEEAAKSRRAVDGWAANADVLTADFLEWSLDAMSAGATFGGILGNPPYVRYQYLEPRDQVLSEQIFARQSLRFTRHTNAWVPFVIASVGLLEAGGRLAMVIPAEILHILHAGSLREFLVAQCQRILVIDPAQLLFDKSLQGTVLLLLEKKRTDGEASEGVCVLPMSDNAFLDRDPVPVFRDAQYLSGDVLRGKWMRVLLSPDELRVLDSAIELPGVRAFRDVATVDVGIVTGANAFFLVNDSVVSQYGLGEFTAPMFGRSEHCPGVIYDDSMHEANRARGLPANFVALGTQPSESLAEGPKAYIARGEAQGLPQRYKCRIREPWYSVPSVYATPIGMLKRSSVFPRLILNTAGAYTTDTAYRIKPKAEAPSLEALVYSFVNSLTALTAELEGRHYGGGVLELVPSEIERLVIPAVEPRAGRLADLDRRIRSHEEADQILVEQDEVVLRAVGLGQHEREVIHQAWSRLRHRRLRTGVEQ